MNLKIISAGAGSGKTYRLTQEMVALLNPDNPNRVRASGIIATTFTAKAAAELQERVRTKLIEEGLVQEAAQLTNALIGTVHGLGVKLLKRFAFEAGVSPEVDIIADEDRQFLFNQSLSTVLKKDRIEQMEYYSERFALRSNFPPIDWRSILKSLTDLARSNAMDADTLEKSKVNSIESFFEFLQKPKLNLTEKEWNDRLLNLIVSTLQEFQTIEDSTKDTQKAIGVLRGALVKLRAKGNLDWDDWVRISKLKTGAKSREAVEEIMEFAAKVEQNPALRSDIEGFITALFDLSIEAIEEYEAYKKRRGLIDYIDMEINVKRLLDHPTVQAALAEELDLLMVDEFQDTNPIQLEIFWKLTRFAKYSIWVGDPKQSIYGFRGADPTLMQAIIDAVGGVKPEDIQEYSWRSRQDIVHAVNAIFVKAFDDMKPEQVALKPVRTKDKDPFEMENALMHWHFQQISKTKRKFGKPWMEDCIARGIKTFLLEKGVVVQPKNENNPRPVQPGDIAVLCRSNHECMTMAEALHNAGIKAAIARNGLLETAEAKLILACLKFILNQSDSLSIAEILLLASQHPIEAVIEHRMNYLEQRVSKYESWANEDRFIHQLNTMRKEVGELSSTEILNLVLDALDLRRIIVSWGNAEQRFANIDTLRKYALQYEEACNRLHTAASLGGFLLWINEKGANDEDAQGSGENPESVNVLTYHKSKGLEWPVVICHSLEQKLRDDVYGLDIVPEQEGVDLNNILGNRWLRYWVNPFGKQSTSTPLENSLEVSKAKEIKRAQALKEEARLLYVGFTRARDYLIIPSRQSPTTWLNRVWHNGQGDFPTLDPYLSEIVEGGTYESPWFWKDENVPIDTEIQAFGRDFERYEIKPTPITYWEAPKGQKAHFSYSINVDEEDFSQHYKFNYLNEKIYSRSISLEPDADEYIVAKIIKAFLCVDNPTFNIDVRTQLGQRLIDNFEAAEMVAVNSLLFASEQYFNYLHQQFKIETIYRKYPIQLKFDDRLFETIVDFIGITDKGLVIVQNTGFAGGNKRWREKTKALANWMFFVQKAAGKVFGLPVHKTMIHFVLQGSLSTFKIEEKAVQKSLF